MSNLIRSGTIGLASGLRSTVTPAVVSWAAATGRLDVPRPTRLLAHPRSATLLGLGAMGEVVAEVNHLVPYSR